MQTLSDELTNLYAGNVRVRVSGIYIIDNQILLVNHSLYGKNQSFWSPPGGGIQFGETAVTALQREIKEETGLVAVVGKFLFVNEHVQSPLHAIELFFEIKSVEGSLGRGVDPEISSANQIIEEVSMKRLEDIHSLPANAYHSIFTRIQSLEQIFTLNRFLSGNEA
ncbi:NUDIX domain-containing protein [Dyadobacter sp. CY326]|uniref:NUDIX domain-containing protein n=1 Tax=Dyadobacter sp. CY326 TaxID=2907300 RepID=UPI001F4336C2|nr:NUDIX domain-containing protein [Dyadobacter sp. CY326]MCE7066012.1 NUDIX domain-containing protein [Dyadobacter sp. CY326]